MKWTWLAKMKRNEIEGLLPAVFQQTLNAGVPKVFSKSNPLTALLEVMEELQAPSEAVLASLDTFFDPRRTSDKFVPYLAHWADLGRLFEDDPGSTNQSDSSGLTISSGLGRLRELVANATYLSQWRGTKKGMLLFLQTATGIKDFKIEENVDLEGKPKAFHISVRAPKEGNQYQRLIERIVALEKPAHITSQVFIEPAGTK